MKKVLSLVLCLLLGATCLGDITFEGNQKVEVFTIAKVKAKGDYKSFIYKVYGPDGKRVKVEKGDNGWLLFTGMPGKYLITATAGKVDKDGGLVLDEGEYEVTIGGDVPPIPPGPVPPNPVPPVPPVVTGLRALIVWESSANHTKEQLNILNSTKVRDYLNKKCKDGKQGWRMYDKDVKVSDKESEVFKALWNDVKDKISTLPCIVLVSDQKAEINQLPPTENDTLALLEKWGGK